MLPWASARADEGPLGPWLEARADEHTAWLEGLAHSRSGPQGLWREWSSPEPMLKDFVPPTSLAPLIRTVQTGVVNISAVGLTDAWGEVERSGGSGFILSSDGLVVTNNHVIAKAQQISVRLADGREFPAEVVGRDEVADVALLRLRGKGLGELPVEYLGDSDRLEVGDWVVAIGNPFGLDHSVAHGMISAKERVIGVGLFDDFIQTDALINPGNSGGPLFNMRGEVVGVNTAIISQGQGIGFAVPINMVKELLPNLRANGQPQRGWLGVDIVESQSATAAQQYAVVKSVFPNSPAAQAGLLPGDRVVAVNGRAIDSYQQLLRKVMLLAPGTEVHLTLLREGTAHEVAAKLASRPAPEVLAALASQGRIDELGLVLRDSNPEVAAALGVPAWSGAIISGVLPRSPAAQVGLQAGDVITEVNRRRVKDVEGLRQALARRAGSTLLLGVLRGDVKRYVALEP